MCKIGAERIFVDQNKVHARAVLIYVVNPATGHVFLARNRKGPCKDLLNGFGGEVKPYEDPIAAAKRELQEETGIVIPWESFQFRGKIEFKNVKKDGWTQTVDCYIYVVNMISNFHIVQLNQEELYGCGEYYIENLPTDQMTNGDYLWTRQLLCGRRIGYAVIARDFDDGSIITHRIEWR